MKKINLTLGVVALLIMVGVILSQWKEINVSVQRCESLEHQLIDAEQRLEFYRMAVEQTEIESLEAATVLESTDAFRELLKMNENEQFQMLDTLKSRL